MSKKKHVSPKPKSNGARFLTVPVGQVTIDVPAENTVADVNMGMLSANGTATPEDDLTDTLRDGKVIVYNDFNVTEPITDDDIASRGVPVDGGTPISGVYHWSSSDVSAFGEDAPTANNNRLYVLARWDRDLMPFGQVSTNSAFKGKNVPPAAPPEILEAKHAKKVTRTDLRARASGRWLAYRKIAAKTPLEGHRLLDATGKVLRASKIAVYAFDVDWQYTDRSHSEPAKVHHVRRPIGDTLCTDAGPSFLSPHNSLIIWQVNWRTRQRVVIVADSQSEADVVDLDPNLDVYVHVNYHRVKPLVVEGTFGLKVRILKR